MSRQQEVKVEQKEERRRVAVIKALEYDLEGSVAHAGGILTGFSVRMGSYETLVTLRAIVAGRAQVCFVGSSSLIDALIKCVRDARSDKLAWRADEYAK